MSRDHPLLLAGQQGKERMGHPELRIRSCSETNSVMYNRRGDLTRHQDCDSHRRCHDDHRCDLVIIAIVVGTVVLELWRKRKHNSDDSCAATVITTVMTLSASELPIDFCPGLELNYSVYDTPLYT